MKTGDLLLKLRDKRLKIAGIFVAVLLILTVFSRISASFMVPIVETMAPQTGFLTHSVSGEGVLVPNKQIAVVPREGLLIEEVWVKEGQTVSPQTPLLRLSVSDLTEQLAVLRLLDQKLSLQARGAVIPSLNPLGEELERNVLRAQEDAKLQTKSDDAALRRAQDDLIDSVNKQYWVSRDNSGKELANPYEAEIRAARRAVQDARERQERNLLEGKRALEDAEQQIITAEQSLKKEQNQVAAARAAAQVQSQIAEIDRQLNALAIEALEVYHADEGVLVAEQAGVVTQLLGKIGARTTGEGVLLLGDTASGYSLEARFTAQQAKHVTVGAGATVSLQGLENELSVSVLGLRPDGNGVIASALLPEGVGTLGGAGELLVTQNTQSYDFCVPTSALREDTAGCFVLIVEDEKSILGVQQVAQRVSVEVLDQTPERAAVSGAFSLDSKVIVSSKRAIQEGERVRLGL